MILLLSGAQRYTYTFICSVVLLKCMLSKKVFVPMWTTYTCMFIVIQYIHVLYNFPINILILAIESYPCTIFLPSIMPRWLLNIIFYLNVNKYI